MWIECENVVKFVPREDGEQEVDFTLENSYRNLDGGIDEQNEFGTKIQEQE